MVQAKHVDKTSRGNGPISKKYSLDFKLQVAKDSD